MSDNTNDSSVSPEQSTETPTPESGDKPKFKKIGEEEETIVVKRKFHDKENRYYGQEDAQEIIVAKFDYMSLLNDEELDKFVENKLVYTPEKTQEYMEELKKNDIFGFMGNMYIVDEVKKTLVRGRKVAARDKKNMKYSFKDEKTTFTKPEIDFALNIGFTEILYRDNKPYGMDEDLTYSYKVAIYEDDNGNVFTTQKGKEVKPSSNGTQTPPEV